MTSFSFALYSSLFYVESGEIDRMNGKQVMNTHNKQVMNTHNKQVMNTHNKLCSQRYYII